MSEDLLLAALERARELVGESVWEKLSDMTRTNVVREELRALEADNTAAIELSPAVKSS